MELVTKETHRMVQLFEEMRNAVHILDKLEGNIVSKGSLEGEYYYTDKQVSELLKVSRRTLQEWRDQSILGFIKLQGKILYRSSDIQTLLEECYIQARK